MGFLKKLFEKKDCEICGGDIGLLGNKKLVDGDMCKNCAAKLSPWFTGRKQSTVADIKAQLAYREENAAELQNGFRPTRTLGEYYKMYVMYENGCPGKFVISDTEDYAAENADIIRFADVVSWDAHIEDYSDELMRENEAGEEVSYNPPRYEFSYDFYIELELNCPYFDQIRFRINRNTLKVVAKLPAPASEEDFDPMTSPEYVRNRAMCSEIAEIVQMGQQGISRSMPAEAQDEAITFSENPAEESEPGSLPMAPADKEDLSDEKTDGSDSGASDKENSPKLGDPGVCPDCGAADQTGTFCEYCGAKL